MKHSLPKRSSLRRPAVAVAALVALSCLILVANAGPATATPPDAAFLQKHCYDCHQGKAAEGGLDLAALSRDLNDGAAQARWIRIFDRVQGHEMPPRDAEQPSSAELKNFLTASGHWLRSHQQAQDAKIGRVRGRRLTRRELERTLHDLLGIDIPLADQLPEEAKTAGFTTVAAGQSMSHFQLQRHLEVVDLALDEALRRALAANSSWLIVHGE